ncbi:MAG: DUF4160 domain-containing protein [Caldilineaceae bacterium]|nr:DUF4160 domain-containing protein [Caldilineaceae bacterium]
MPTVLRIGRYRFHFFSNERNEPAHIHVKDGDRGAKFWLEPVDLAANYGFRSYELSEIRRLVLEHQMLFLEKWYEHFN